MVKRITAILVLAISAGLLFHFTDIFTQVDRFIDGLFRVCDATNYPPEDWEKARMRTYTDISVDLALQKAKEVIRLSDPEDIVFEDKRGRFVAVRNFKVSSLLKGLALEHEWRVEAWTEGDSTTVTVELHQSANKTFDLGTDSEIARAFDDRVPCEPATYELFWKRLNYLLELERTWPSCEWFEVALDRANGSEIVQGLCAVGTVQGQPPTTGAGVAEP